MGAMAPQLPTCALVAKGSGVGQILNILTYKGGTVRLLMPLVPRVPYPKLKLTLRHQATPPVPPVAAVGPVLLAALVGPI